jgi:3'(2'), 5'-bisphosphate nucleotidase
LDAINLGAYAGGPHGRHWTLDPVDGTKGFLRGGQYAICLALIEDGIVHLGVVGCPNLPVQRGLLENVEAMKQATKHTIFVAVRGEGAYQVSD